MTNTKIWEVGLLRDIILNCEKESYFRRVPNSHDYALAIQTLPEKIYSTSLFISSDKINSVELCDSPLQLSHVCNP